MVQETLKKALNIQKKGAGSKLDSARQCTHSEKEKSEKFRGGKALREREVTRSGW